MAGERAPEEAFIEQHGIRDVRGGDVAEGVEALLSADLCQAMDGIGLDLGRAPADGLNRGIDQGLDSLDGLRLVTAVLEPIAVVSAMRISIWVWLPSSAPAVQTIAFVARQDRVIRDEARAQRGPLLFALRDPFEVLSVRGLEETPLVSGATMRAVVFEREQAMSGRSVGGARVSLRRAAVRTGTDSSFGGTGQGQRVVAVRASPGVVGVVDLGQAIT